MRSNIGRALLLVALVVPLSGCPVPGVSLGNWLFTFASGGLVGLDIRDAGQAQAPDPLPPEATSGFGGTLSWVQNGQTFTLMQVQGAVSAEYTGTVDSRNRIIDGTWTQTFNGSPSASGTWFAEKL
jgi:hypothetical protein